jgi:hypothetical protein
MYATLLFVNKDRVFEGVAYQPYFVAGVIVIDVRYPESFGCDLEPVMSLCPTVGEQFCQ